MSLIKVEKRDRVLAITINRPEVLNALNTELLDELLDVMIPMDVSSEIGCFMITGSERAFAAGADIAELASLSYSQMANQDMLGKWEVFANLRTPKIAAVSGYALGGGCELAMMCDVIYAASNAKFGQPEIKLGLIPGMGGSQRLTRMIGKAKAMDLLLTGRFIDAQEAERAGLVARIIENEKLLEESWKAALTISSYAKTAAIAACEAVDRAENTSLSEGLLFERRTYHSLWATPDAIEGMNAFLEKRVPVFNAKD